MPDGTSAGSCHHAAVDAAQGLSLRILATTDIHMNVLPYNYLSDRPCDRHGLARTAALIERFRNSHPNTLLLDNGDFLQGNPLGDYVAEIRGVGPQQPHPVVAAMNALGYDAAALGNHDFNYGLPFLRRAASQARFPFLSANLHIRRGPNFPRYTIVRRHLVGSDGIPRLLRIGVIGLLPPQTGEWDCDLSPHLYCRDIVETARELVPEMRADGADLVLALAHTGIGPLAHSSGMEHAATALAAVDGVDVVVAGHTHQVFPGPHIPPAPGVDPQRGTLAGKPAVMAGFGGSHLGVIDLDLHHDTVMGWRVADFTVRAEPVDVALPTCSRVTTPALNAHRATLRHYRRRVGYTEAPLNSFFSLLGFDPGLRLVNMAQRWHVRNRLRGTRWEGLPILSGAAPFRAGGRGGPDHYTNVPAGPLTLRNLADLYLFPNRICAIHLTGAQLRDWLERAAGQFCQIAPGESDAQLISTDFPCYNFDVIDGVTWKIDLTSPRRFAPDGQLLNPLGGRIRDLHGPDGPVLPESEFILATNTYRLATCGLFASLAGGNPVVLSDNVMTRDVLRLYVRKRRRIPETAQPSFRFVPMPGTSALFETSPAGLSYLTGLDLPGFRQIESAGQSKDGFAMLRLHL